VLERYNLSMVLSHRLQLGRPDTNNSNVHKAFAEADAIICNILSDKFQEFSTNVLFKNCKPDCNIVSFVPPCCACWWPVAPYWGEEGVVWSMGLGISEEEMIKMFLNGSFYCEFPIRFKDQIDRLAFRERNRDVKISDFIKRHYKDFKMFFTINHPTFNLVAYIVDCCLAELGFKQLGEEHSLSLPVNHAGFGNHYPETDYEWDFYGFRYPKRYTNELGGPNVFYPHLIGEVITRRMMEPVRFCDPEDDY